MKLTINNKVKFDELTHSYWIGKEMLIGVTSLMRKHHLSPDYSNIPEDTLKHAADLGTQAHQAIEAYCDGLPVTETRLIRTFKDLSLNICATEYLVSDNKTVASSIDLVNHLGGDEYELLDMKRISTVHTEPLSWQLGIYKYLFEKANPGAKVVNCYCLPIKKGNRDDIENDSCQKLVKIEPQPAEEVERLLECESNGEEFTPAVSDPACPEYAVSLADLIDASEVVAFHEAMSAIAVREAEIKAYNDYIDKCKAIILQRMMDMNVAEIEDDVMSIKVKAEYERTSVDSARLKKEKPDIYDRYMKVTIVKPSLIIKIK